MAFHLFPVTAVNILFLAYILKKHTYLAQIVKNMLFTWSVHWLTKKYVFMDIFAKIFKLTVLLFQNVQIC